MKNATLPGGFEGYTVEVFHQDGELKAIYNSNIIPFIELPDHIKARFETELIRDKTAMNSLRRDFGLTDGAEMLEQYMKCRYGGFDNTPDMQGNHTTPEYWDCGRRNICPAEGKVCKLPIGVNGNITPREMQVISLLAKGNSDKQIAVRLNISTTTVITYQNRIREKLGVTNRVGIIMYAVNNNLIKY